MPAKQGSPPRNITRKRKVAPVRSGWRIFQRLRRQDLILLTGLLALACVSVLTVALLVLRYQQAPEPTLAANSAAVPGPQPTHTVTFVQVTGLSQYKLAQAAAQRWAGDAQLVSANAVWPKVVSKAQVGEPTLWTYRFFSVEKQRLFFVNVAPEGQVETIEHVKPVSLPPRPLPLDSWTIDSSAALAIWLDYGGAKVLGENPGLEILIQLRTVNNNANPVWIVAGLNNRTEQIHTVVIDANQGVVTTTQVGS